MLTLLIAVIYLAFIALGLPDSLLGAAWPVMYTELAVPLSYSGIIFIIISLGTVISSLNSDRLIKKTNSSTVTIASVGLTAVAIFGFAYSHSFLALCIWAIPFGLGAGSVDAVLNNYVALHFESKHMSWLHCMWGVGATIGPYLMSLAVTKTGSWHYGYKMVGIMQLMITFIIFISLPLWTKKELADKNGDNVPVSYEPIPLKEVIKIKGAKEMMIAFFSYCGLEQTVGLWASSYLVIDRGIDEVTAAKFTSIYFLGVTVGRAINGLLTMKFSDEQLINTGEAIISIGAALLLLSASNQIAIMGLMLIGLGCAPIYPSIIHSTPKNFGRDKSQAMIGVQMASAYVGTTIMPPLFGALTKKIDLKILPIYILILLILQSTMYKRVLQITGKVNDTDKKAIKTRS
ncbi:MAG: MFS transporter [Clostridiaceae bacterium]|nr:MFS transporter [Clostridiaceae bacterium]